MRRARYRAEKQTNNMKIYKAIQIGDYHLNHCEDYLFSGELNNDKILCAVMDGCTTAIDSYFISTMVGKILRKISIEQGYKEMYETNSKILDLDLYLKSILKNLFSELKISKNQLMLETKEMLTTLVILLLDKKNNEGIALVVGDGLVCIDGKITEFDQENKPDYLGFHLAEDFDLWYDNQKQKIRFDNFKDISIATDGIFTFLQIAKSLSNEKIDPIKYLIVNEENQENEDMLNLKIKRLENTFGLKPTDDLAIIRIIE